MIDIKELEEILKNIEEVEEKLRKKAEIDLQKEANRLYEDLKKLEK